MARRVELGAGIAAAVLSVLALVVILVAPLFGTCTVRVARGQPCPPGAVRYDSLLHIGLDASGWAFLIAMLLITLTAAGGAVAEAGYGLRAGAVPLWTGSLITLMACALTAPGAGLFYLPCMVALALATYASILQRVTMRRNVRSTPPASVVENDLQQPS